MYTRRMTTNARHNLIIFILDTARARLAELTDPADPEWMKMAQCATANYTHLTNADLRDIALDMTDHDVHEVLDIALGIAQNR